MSTKKCECCGGNGWEGSNCKELSDRYDRLWLDYHELVRRNENKHLVIADQVKELAMLSKMRTALELIRDCDFVITLPDRMDAVRAIAREALE
jgi:hypothetical protein